MGLPVPGSQTGGGTAAHTSHRAAIRAFSITFATLILAYCVYATAFIWRTSFLVGGRRYFCLFDDAMVSMRYAKNLAAGFGLVWNPGQPPVEGFTNPLWTLIMAGVHLAWRDAPTTSLLIQLLGAALLTVNLFWLRRLALVVGQPVHAMVAVVLTACYLPLNNWSLRGSEVALLTPLITAAACLSIEAYQGRRFSPWPFILLGVGILVRLDGAVPFAALTLGLLGVDRAHRRQIVIWSSAILLASIVPQTLARYWYYGDWLPNTYFLKMTGFPVALRLLRGVWTLVRTLNFYMFVLLLVRRPRDPGSRLLLLVIAAQCLYSVWVGGDAWESWGGSNRYVAPIVPLLFLLSGRALREEVISEHETGRFRPEVRFAVVLACVVCVMNASHGSAPAEALLLTPPVQTTDNRKMVLTADAIKEVASPRATVAVVSAGIVPYFADRPCVDLLGKNDRTIARLPMRIRTNVSPLTLFYPGHLKWDYHYSIGRLKPDVVAELWWSDPALSELSAYRRVSVRGIRLYLRSDSRALLPGVTGRENSEGL